jgi:hypothetical protein
VGGAEKANRLLIKIVLFNLFLYFVIAQLVSLDLLPADSVYLSLVLFLCFGISIGNLLIVGLGQRVDLEQVPP